MKLTEHALKQLIKEELNNILNERITPTAYFDGKYTVQEIKDLVESYVTTRSRMYKVSGNYNFSKGGHIKIRLNAIHTDEGPEYPGPPLGVDHFNRKSQYGSDYEADPLEEMIREEIQTMLAEKKRLPPRRKKSKKLPPLKLDTRELRRVNQLIEPYGIMLTQLSGLGLSVVKLQGKSAKLGDLPPGSGEVLPL